VTGLLDVPVTLATAGRVLAQLRADRRTVAMLLVVPSALLAVTKQALDSRTLFDQVGLSLVGIFPLTTMFLVTSVAMLRERTSGTLERLLTTPMTKLDLLLGYGLAFSVAATAQTLVVVAIAYGLLGLQTPGSRAFVVAVALLSALLGTSLGLLASAFATSEFQAVQFLPAVILPRTLLGGLFVSREALPDWLHALSDLMPLSYAIEALQEVGRRSIITVTLLHDLAVLVGVTLVALVAAAASLRRRTPSA
jgi:ABC-2 type transport system permease protein